MTKGAALQQFFGRFMTAYPSNAVPDDAVLPYLTYDAVMDTWANSVSITVICGFIPHPKLCQTQRRKSF